MYLNILAIFFLIMQTCDSERIITTLKYSSHNVKPVIVNGEPVSGGTVPYVVSIKKLVKSGLSTSLYKNRCGGSIINTRKVLTAGHCFEADNFRYAKNPSPLAVVAGDLRNGIEVENFTSNEKTQWRRISKVIVHPFFNFPMDDLAIVFVLQNWEFSEWIRPIKMARLGMDYPDTCYASGYGRIGHGALAKNSEVLLRTKIDVMARNVCTELWEIPMDDFVCSASLTTDVAVGDSGGPLACHDTSDPEEEPGKELLVGVTGGKNYDLTTIFLRVSAYKDWIDHQNINNANHNELRNFYFVCFIISFLNI